MIGGFVALVAGLRRFPDIPQHYMLWALFGLGLAVLTVLFYMARQFAFFPENVFLQNLTTALFSIVLLLLWAWISFLLVIVLFRPSASL
jgi:hypothetical protein